MEHGFVRIGVAIPKVTVADCEKNLEEIKTLVDRAHRDRVDVLLFPELSLTGYTCGDLFFQSTLLQGAEAALKALCAYTTGKRPLVVLGLPISAGPRLFNVAVLISSGKLLGAVPKSYLPNYGEFYEKRWFAPAGESSQREISLAGQTVPFGTDLLFSCENYPALVLGVEICEDIWAPLSPSIRQSLLGATVLLNLTAGNALVGKAQICRELVRGQSDRCFAVYAYAGAGVGESTTDLVFPGQGIVAEKGRVLVETEWLSSESQFQFCDVDIELLQKERFRCRTFGEIPPEINTAFRSVPFSLPPVTRPLVRQVDTIPFLPPGPREAHCQEIFHLQKAALARRLETSGLKTALLGISGGLDSTLALLVTVSAYEALGRDRKDILGLSMPGFGTTARTSKNARALMDGLNISQREIPIGPACLQHFKDIGHDPAVQDVTYENTQARERSQILMDMANQKEGLVIGSGNLSELALGFTTYGGDHMSMYAINAGIPKTIVRMMVEWLAKSQPFGSAISAVLEDILETPVSPELLPPGPEGDSTQKTEALIGPYILHDFFLCYAIRYGFSPGKVVCLAESAFAGQFDRSTILTWLRVFYRRFFSQQFKRSCMPDGPKVGLISLSPRGDWRMPSDTSAALWQKELDELMSEQ